MSGAGVDLIFPFRLEAALDNMLVDVVIPAIALQFSNYYSPHDRLISSIAGYSGAVADQAALYFLKQYL